MDQNDVPSNLQSRFLARRSIKDLQFMFFCRPLGKERTKKIILTYVMACADPGIFVRGGGPGQSDKKALTTFFFFFFF